MAFLEGERRTELRQVRVRLEEIEATLFSHRRAVNSLDCCVTGPGRQPERAPRRGWKPFRVGDRWGGLDQAHWFRMRVTIPKAMKGKRVVAGWKFEGLPWSYDLYTEKMYFNFAPASSD